MWNFDKYETIMTTSNIDERETGRKHESKLTALPWPILNSVVFLPKLNIMVILAGRDAPGGDEDWRVNVSVSLPVQYF